MFSVCISGFISAESLSHSLLSVSLNTLNACRGCVTLTRQCYQMSLLSSLPQVNVGGGKYVHLRVYQDLQQNVQLAGYQLDKEKDSPLTYF